MYLNPHVQANNRCLMQIAKTVEQVGILITAKLSYLHPLTKSHSQSDGKEAFQMVKRNNNLTSRRERSSQLAKWSNSKWTWIKVRRCPLVTEVATTSTVTTRIRLGLRGPVLVIHLQRVNSSKCSNSCPQQLNRFPINLISRQIDKNLQLTNLQPLNSRITINPKISNISSKRQVQ